MKYKLLYILPLFAVLFGLSACSTDDADNTTPPDNVVRVVANVTGMTTRGSFTTETLGNMGLGIKTADDGKYSYSNELFTKGDNSVWTSSSVLYWQNETTPVDIVAYAPYKDATLTEDNLCDETLFPVEVQATQTEGDNSSDFLVFKQTGFVPKKDLTTGSAAIPVVFQHALSKLTVNVTFGNEYNDKSLSQGSITGVVVGGTRTKGVCDFTKAVPAVTADESVAEMDVNPYFVNFTAGQGTTNAVATYSCILIPQTVDSGSFSISITVNTSGSPQELVWTSTQELELKGNTSYTLNLSVGSDYIVAGECTVESWDTGSTLNMRTD